MAVVKNLIIRAGADFSGMRREMQRASQNIAEFKSNVSRAVRGISATLATIGLGAAIKNATKEAMVFEASIQQINRLMGQSAGAFTEWANTQASAFGMARSEAVRYGAVYANLLSGFSAGTAETARRTQDLLKASAVVASSTGRTMDDVMERIRSGLLGNTEAIEDLGINVNVALIESTKAFKQFANGRSWQQLDFNAQQTIRYFAILEQAASKYGLELAQNTSSRQAAFTAQLKNAQLALGQAFLPIYNAILPALTRFATALANTMQYVAAFTQALFGGNQAQQQSASVDAQAAAVGGLGDAYEKAGKKAQKSVAGFDQVNLVGGKSDGKSGGGSVPMPDTGGQEGALSGVSNAMENVANKAKEMADKVRTAIGNVRDFIVQNKEIIIAGLAGIASALATVFVANNAAGAIAGIRTALLGLGSALGALLSPIGLIAIAIGAAVAAFVYFYQTNESFRGVVDGILTAIGNAAKWLWTDALVPLGQYLATVFVAAWNATKVAAEWLWKNVLVPFGNFLLWFWNNVITPLANVLKGALKIAFTTVSDVAKSLWKNVLVPLGDFFKEAFGPAVEALSAVFKVLWNNVLKPFATFLSGVLKVAFKGLTDTIVWLWNKVMEPLVSFLAGRFKSTFNTVFEAIGGVINGLKTAFIGLMNFITGVFTGDWEKAWNGVKNIFKGVFNSLYNIIKVPLNSIIDGINTVIGGLNKINIDMPGWLGGGSFGVKIPEIPKLATGTNYIQREGLAYLHEGEAVVPKKYNPAAGGESPELLSALKELIKATKNNQNMQVVISYKEIGQASARYSNEQARRGNNPQPSA